METSERVAGIIAALKQEYPDALCALHYGKDYELMIAVRLSAQCTDARVNLVTPALFARYPTLDAFAEADDVLRRGAQAISDLINNPGFVNLDFADVTSVMKDAGYAHMGMGSATGKDKATVAADMAISSPLLETSIDGAKGLIINITASADVSLDDIDAASTMIKDKVSDDANIIWGAVIDDKMEDAISVTVIATGFNADGQIAKKNLTDAVSSASAPVAAKEEPKSTTKDKTDDDDDTFYDIMSIFNK